MKTISHSEKRIRWQPKREDGRFDFKYKESSTPSCMEECLIYFAMAGLSKKIKVGRTRWNIDTRMTNLISGSPERLVLIGCFEGKHLHEYAIHHHLRDYWSHSEWFKSDKAMSFLDEIRFKMSDGLDFDQAVRSIV